MLAIATTLSAAATQPPSGAAATAAHSVAEVRLLAAMRFIRQGDYDRALDDLGALTEARPNFRLAQLVYAELMAARAGRSVTSSLSARMRKQREALLAEAETRWGHRRPAADDGQVPSVILQVAPRYKRVIVVDLSRNRLYVFYNDQGTPRLVSDFYTTIGRGGGGKQAEGDLRTPIGIYHVTQYLDDAELPERYGIGALPINYPNALDRARDRTGYGIWLHGVPRDTYARSPRASDGCVVISNTDFKSIRAHVTVGRTPVVLADRLTWVPAAEVEKQRIAVLAAIETRRHNRSTGNARQYLASNSPDDRGVADADKRALLATGQKTRAARTPTTAVNPRRISLFRYPGEAHMIKAIVPDGGRRRATESTTASAQYWQRSDSGDWQLVLETDAD